MNKKLWEIEHDYYCSELNYYERDSIAIFDSWCEFMQEREHEDRDYNLIFRFDWEENYDTEDGYVGDILKLFYMQQRRGLFHSIFVKVKKSEEDEIKKWLIVRAYDMKKLWEPLI